jgi:hypothetical protein
MKLKTDKISILCPSRGRPLLAHKMITSAKATAVTDVEFKLYLNDDDPELAKYKELIDEKYYTVGPDRSTCYSWNRLAETASGNILFLMGDDADFVTHAWDRAIIEAFSLYPDRIACVYPITGVVGKKKNPHFCVHKNWVDAVGYFVPPHFWHYYVDTWVGSVASRLGRYHCLHDVTVSIQKHVNDETERRIGDNCKIERDKYIWEKTQRHLAADEEVLRNYIKDFK